MLREFVSKSPPRLILEFIITMFMLAGSIGIIIILPAYVRVTDGLIAFIGIILGYWFGRTGVVNNDAS
jgi:hypothetical protein